MPLFSHTVLQETEDSSSATDSDTEDMNSLEKEAKLFTHGIPGASLPSYAYRPRRSFKRMRGIAVVNKRQFKECPLCGTLQKQPVRHVKTVHRNLSEKKR